VADLRRELQANLDRLVAAAEVRLFGEPERWP
jgi:hypothetical protein